MILDPLRKVSSAKQIAVAPRLHTAAAAYCMACAMLAAPHAVSQTASTEGYPSGETVQNSALTEQDDEAGPVKPGLITPTLAADPKLGTNVGGGVAYIKKLDRQSTASMVGASVSYSDTDSITGGVGHSCFGALIRGVSCCWLVPPRSMNTMTFCTGRKPRQQIVCTPLGFGTSSN